MNRLSTAPAVFCAIAALLNSSASLLLAQGAGPMRPPAPSMPRPPAASKPEPPPVPPAEIIKRFAAKEDEMLRASLGYGFEKSVLLEEIGPDNKPSGQVEIVTAQTVAPDGQRYEKVVRRSESTLHVLQMERGDVNFIDSTPLFPLTTSQIPKYAITYEGTQPLDELNVYVFGVQPLALDRTHAYFSGVVWVDQEDFVIVKTSGKWVNEFGDVTSSSLPFTVFEIYRQQVGKDLWFPADSRSDATFEQGNVQVPIRIIIRWKDYTPAGAAAPPGTPPAPATR